MKLTTERGRDSDEPAITGFQEGDYRLGPSSASAEEFQKRETNVWADGR